MKLLLDTHALVWYRTKHPDLSERALSAIEKSKIFVSAISLWELTLLIEKGKIPFKGNVSSFLYSLMNDDFILLNIKIEDLEKITTLPKIHKDPFDRFLIAQALNHDLTLVTKDAIIPKYSLETLW